MIQVAFDEVSHSYTLVDNPEKKFISATQLIHRYTNPFDGEYWSLYKAIERVLGGSFAKLKFKLLKNKSADYLKSLFVDHPKEGEIYRTQTQIKEEWKQKNKEACDTGTAFHNEREAESIGAKIVQADEHALEVFPFHMHLDLGELSIGYYPELRLYNLDYEVSGTSDCVYVLPGRQVIIEDYKTNKELKFENSFAKMLGPLNHLDDCNWNHYRIQLSLYAYMLEQFGYTVKRLAILYKGEYLDFVYLRQEVIDMLNHYKNTLDGNSHHAI